MDLRQLRQLSWQPLVEREISAGRNGSLHEINAAGSKLRQPGQWNKFVKEVEAGEQKKKNMFAGETKEFFNDWFEKNKRLFPKNGGGWFHNNPDGWAKQNEMLDQLFAHADVAEDAVVEDLKRQLGYAERKAETKFIATSGKVDGSSLRQRAAKYMQNAMNVSKKNKN